MSTTRSSIDQKDLKYSKQEEFTPPSSSRRAWSATLRNPRIVRVSRAFGGKDRHSKVTTIRGLRDRRVRLSVQTAMQIYDLQDKLGVNQPSKVVEWLIKAAQHEIDKLPPLEMKQFNAYPLLFKNHPHCSYLNELGNGTVVEDMGSLQKTNYWGCEVNREDEDNCGNFNSSSSVSLLEKSLMPHCLYNRWDLGNVNECSTTSSTYFSEANYYHQLQHCSLIDSHRMQAPQSLEGQLQIWNSRQQQP